MTKQHEVNNLLLEEGLLTHVSEPEGQAIQSGSEPAEDTNDADTGTDTGADADSGGSEAKDTSVKGYAEKLGIDAKELYEKITVPMADGSILTLGELKDLSATSRVEREGYEAANAELMVQHRNLALIGSMLPETLSKQAADAIEAHAQREVQLLAKALPTWEDPAVAAREEKSIMNLAGKYGLSPRETEALITDHRLVKLLRDVAVRGDAATSSTPKAAVRSTATATSNKAVLDRARAPNANKADKLAGIRALIT